MNPINKLAKDDNQNCNAYVTVSCELADDVVEAFESKFRVFLFRIRKLGDKTGLSLRLTKIDEEVPPQSTRKVEKTKNELSVPDYVLKAQHITE